MIYASSRSRHFSNFNLSLNATPTEGIIQWIIFHRIDLLVTEQIQPATIVGVEIALTAPADRVIARRRFE
jgi:hypothetical protein